MDKKHGVLRVEKVTCSGNACCTVDQLGKRWHYHDAYELHYFKIFSGRALIGDYRGTISDNTLFLLAPNLPHCWKGHPVESLERGESQKHCRVLLSEQSITKVFEIFPELRKSQALLKEARFGIEFLGDSDIAEVGEMMQALDCLEGCARVSGFFAILDKLLKCQRRTLNSRICISHADALVSASLDRALEYLKHNFTAQVTLEASAEVASMSKSHFCRSFKRAYGAGFVEYLNKLRVEHACELLRTSELSIAAIASECGYENIASFNRNFKKYVNKSPSSFRRFR